MPRKHTAILLVILLLLVVVTIIGLKRFHSHSVPPPSPAGFGEPVTAAPNLAHPPVEQARAVPVLPKTIPSAVVPKPKTKPSAKKPAAAPVSSTGAPLPPSIEVHKELIPKDITIVRCYYSQEIAPPLTKFGFDLNGSGFTTEFEKMITVDSGQKDVRVTNLHLVTANQIHGEMEVGPDAPTAFVFPRVLIKKLPAFVAPDPFAVVRRGEILTIIFISMEDNGRAGRFRVISNLEESMAKDFRIEPSTAGLEISNVEFHLPFAVEGTLRIGQRVPPGDYGLVITLDHREVYRRDGMIRIVRPNVGETGFVQGVMTAEHFHRPGDAVQFYLQGSGLSPKNVIQLQAKVSEFDMGQASFTYISGGQMRFSFQVPSQAPPGVYTVIVQGAAGEPLFTKKEAFQLVPPNWVAGAQVSPPVRPGQKSQLRIIGRDFAPDFHQHLTIETDEPGIQIGAFQRSDPSLITAEISVGANVAPGDYWLHLAYNGKKIEPPYGSIIKIEAKF